MDVIELLTTLIGIPSVNPGYPNVPPEQAGEARLAAYLVQLLGQHGFQVEQCAVQPGRPNVIAYRAGTSTDCLAFCAHLDTVPVTGMSIAPFAATQRQQRVWGRGSADTKGAIAAMIAAAVAEITAGTMLPSLLLLFTCDEEAGFTGARAFVEAQRPPLRGVVIGEPTDNALRTAHKGLYRCDIKATGVAAHASMPEHGINAIYRLAQATLRLQDLATRLAQSPQHPVLGNATLNVGTCQGGSAVNMVPAAATLSLDRRLLPSESASLVDQELAAALHGLEGIERGSAFLCVPGFEIEPGHPWLNYVQTALGDAGSGPLPYATDASILHAAGIPCVILGPGEAQQAHRDDESVACSSLRRAVAQYRSIMRGQVV